MEEYNNCQNNSQKSPFLLYLGLFLIVLSFVLYGGLLVVPFLPISSRWKGASITGLIVLGEFTFWVGLVFAGKSAYESLKNKWKSFITNFF